MIFVTVGTHEQPFDRLVEAADRLKGEKIIDDDIFIQTGYSVYKPRYCEYKNFLRYDEMMDRMDRAGIVVTHGGTGSIMLVLYHGKIPVVMPRQKKYREHIDDHQVLFCKHMAERNKILPVYEPDDLAAVIKNYFPLARQLQIPGIDEELTPEQKREIFARKLNDICLQLLKKK